MSAICCPMWIFCCSIRWISSPCWLSKWMGLAFMRPGASRQAGRDKKLHSGEVRCSVPAPPYRRQWRKRKNPDCTKGRLIMPKIIRNAIRCKKCGDVIESKTVHDFKFCSCGSCAVDGGLDYLRRCGNLGDWEELSKVEKVEGNNALT